jgi:hypothetical protein
MEPTQQEQLVDVAMSPSVGPMLAQHMEATGRGNVEPLKIQHRVQMAVWKQWGSGAVKFYQDEGGGGGFWYVSVASALDSEDLVAIIRSVHGTRMVCAVVESDELQGFLKGEGWKTEEARGISAELAEEIRRLEEAPPARPGRPGVAPPSNGSNGSAALAVVAEPQGDDPRLIVWWEETEVAEGSVAQEAWGPPKVKEVTYAVAQQEVLRLLMKGHRVQVWENPKSPAITVSL